MNKENILKNNSTPNSINELVYNLLEVKENDFILDIGSGVGSFLNLASNKSSLNPLFGIDLDLDSVELSKSILNESNNNLLNGKTKYNKIFSNFTFGIKDKKLVESLINNDLPLEVRNTSDYYFMNLLYRNLDKSGIITQ